MSKTYNCDLCGDELQKGGGMHSLTTVFPEVYDACDKCNDKTAKGFKDFLGKKEELISKLTSEFRAQVLGGA